MIAMLKVNSAHGKSMAEYVWLLCHAGIRSDEEVSVEGRVSISVPPTVTARQYN